MIKKGIHAASNENQSTSIRKVNQFTAVPSAIIHLVVRNCMGMYPYKLQMSHELNECDYIYQLNFCAWLRDSSLTLTSCGQMKLTSIWMVTLVDIIAEFGQLTSQSIIYQSHFIHRKFNLFN